MRLKSIKLAGFKSFVDPTTVHFPRSMSGIVGPNGCGKSNVIDAVRWVMGESSAKHLRGESMADVIFNGSTSRKPVGQASIELIFDNSGGVLRGEFAAYQEVSVKRLVNRDGQAQYFLNSNKCRKKDVTDLFLGTGLGPRSYAIIEQGTISRMIESKPEELRVFIEEAAGISRYKERRRETENRIRHTRDNLERLTDIREELDKQLQNLQRQAKAAERYKQLKAEERHKKALLSAYRWHQLNQEECELKQVLADKQIALEQDNLQRLKADTSLEQLRLNRQQANDDVNQAQADYYGSGAEIAKLEQQIKNVKEREQELKAELAQLHTTLDDLLAERDAEQQQLLELQEELAQLAPELQAILSKAEDSAETLANAEESTQSWQHKWDEHTRQRNELQRSAEVEQTRIQQTEKQIERLLQRKAELQNEQQSGDFLSDDSDSEEFDQQIVLLETDLEAKTSELQGLLSAEKSQRSQVEKLQTDLNEANTRLQRLHGEQTTLQAMQHHDNRAVDKARLAWLQAHELDDSKELVDCFNIDAAWETALEALLGRHLGARVVSRKPCTATTADKPAQDSDCLDTLSFWANLQFPLPEGLELVFGEGTDAVSTQAFGSYAEINTAFRQWFGELQPVADHRAARQCLRQQPQSQCLLPDGSIIASNWLAGPPRKSNGMGVLARNRRLEEVRVAIQHENQNHDRIMQARQGSKQLLSVSEQQQEQLRKQVAELNKNLLRLKAEASARQAREHQLAKRRAGIADELAKNELLLGDENSSLRESREIWQQALLELEMTLEEKDQLISERDSSRLALAEVRELARQQREAAHQLQIRNSSLSAQQNSGKKALQKTEMSLERIANRMKVIEENLKHQENPLDDLQLQLEQWLGLHLQQEDQLQQSRDKLNDIENSLNAGEDLRLQAEHRLQDTRKDIESLRLRLQEIDVRKITLSDQLAEHDLDIQQMLPGLQEVGSESSLLSDIEALATKVGRLGAINLAAIDEFRAQSERKVYLDAQDEDLQQALATLESAIRKIDKETRSRFKETFDQVNSGLQGLFPKVFGGGSASLELTGEDLLETGVTIMARPPGKKNSTIHLLSGGEKALTAIALIFSIFRLNPAPFCMLDEVDAPLDDANVTRYTTLVKEMAKQVQFIYITHNKIAMEMADHLLGVTMHEPGVSRLVSVDVEAAAAMAAM